MGDKIRRLEGAGADDRTLACVALKSLRRCFADFEFIRIFWCAAGVLGVVYSVAPRRRFSRLQPREVRFELFFDDRWEVRPRYQLLCASNPRTGVGVAGIGPNPNIRTEANVRMYAKELLRWGGKGFGDWFDPYVGDFEVVSTIGTFEFPGPSPFDYIDEHPTYDN